MPKRQKQGVLCLEGNWDHRHRLTNTSTVRPILDLLAGQKQINFIHKDVATADELKHYLRKWLQKQYQAYNIGYLAFHGAPGALCVGKEDVSLDELAEIIDGKGSGRILYFGSCSTLATDQEDEIKQFLKKTKIKAVCGYSEEIPWIESAAFEVLLIDALSSYQRIHAANNFLQKDYPNLCKRLDFRMVW